MNQGSLGKTCKNLLIPCKENEFQPTLLSSNWFYFALSFVIVLKILSVIIGQGYFGASIFNEISRQDIYSLVNNERSTQGLNELKIDPTLELAAQMKVADIQANNYFAHISPAGLTPWHWINKSGYSYQIAGENLAMNFISSVDAFGAWMNSDGHRRNILNNQFADTGIASGRAVINGEETVVIVQMFGKKKEQNIISKQVVTQVGAKEVPAPRPTPTQTSSVNKVSQKANPITPLAIETNESDSKLFSSKAINETLYSADYVLKDIMKWVFYVSIVVLALKIFVAIKTQFPRLILKALVLIIVAYALGIGNWIELGHRGAVIIDEGSYVENK